MNKKVLENLIKGAIARDEEPCTVDVDYLAGDKTTKDFFTQKGIEHIRYEPLALFSIPEELKNSDPILLDQVNFLYVLDNPEKKGEYNVKKTNLLRTKLSTMFNPSSNETIGTDYSEEDGEEGIIQIYYKDFSEYDEF